VDIDQFHEDLAAGTLPAVAYMVPAGSSEHPPGVPREGQRFVRNLITGLMRSEYWSSSAFMWAYDDWGGWYDHVPPPRVDEFGYGFRTPALLVSPYARRGHIDSTTLDFTSALKFIQENWGVKPLADRDRAASSIAGAFDFSQPPRAAVLLPGQRNGRAVQPHRKAAVYPLYLMALVVTFALFVVARGRIGPYRLRLRRKPVAQ
jgi:phospholipase C